MKFLGTFSSLSGLVPAEMSRCRSQARKASRKTACTGTGNAQEWLAFPKVPVVFPASRKSNHLDHFAAFECLRFSCIALRQESPGKGLMTCACPDSGNRGESLAFTPVPRAGNMAKKDDFQRQRKYKEMEGFLHKSWDEKGTFQDTFHLNFSPRALARSRSNLCIRVFYMKCVENSRFPGSRNLQDRLRKLQPAHLFLGSFSSPGSRQCLWCQPRWWIQPVICAASHAR